MYPRVPVGQPIPGKTWLRVTDALALHIRHGRAWVEAGRPESGDVYDRFIESERECLEASDAIWAARWTEHQRREWRSLIEDKQLQF